MFLQEIIIEYLITFVVLFLTFKLKNIKTMKKIFISILLISLSLSTFSQSNYRDIVHLKNGSVIKGIIIEQVPNKQIKIETADGSVFVYNMNEIEKMSKEKVMEQPYRGKNSDENFTTATSKGSVVLSGSSNLSFSSVSPDEGDSENQFVIKTSFGNFVTDNFAVGATLNYEDYESASSFLLGPTLRYYFGTSNIKPFIQGEYLFGNIKYDDYYDDDEKFDVNAFAIGGGAAFFLNQHISIDLSISYNTMSIEDDDSNGIAIDAGISVYF